MAAILKAGAGKAKIIFPEGYFPQDGYAGTYNDMYARVLIIECGMRMVLISMELPSIRPFELMDGLRDQAAALTAVPREQVWLCMTHSLSAPHVPKDQSGAQFRMHMDAVSKAICQATMEALRAMKPARIGFGKGESSVTVSREIESVDGWWIGLSGKDPVDDTLYVIRIDGENGKPLALVYNHALKPCVLEETVMSDGKRYASADLCGEGSRIAEEKYGVPALFFMGAGGDVFPKQKGHYLTPGADGHFQEVCHQEKAYDILHRLGEELGKDLIDTVEKIRCVQTEVAIYLKQVSMKVPGQKPYPRDTAPKPPIKAHSYLPDVDQQVDYSVFTLGKCAIVGVKSEVGTPTMDQLKASSPYEQTMLFSMVNGGQSYIADERSFSRFEYPALHTSLGRGTAETFVEKTVSVLNEIYKKGE